MKIEGTQIRSIWPTPDGSVEVIDQTKLPHRFATVRLSSMADAVHAINSMVVRGAPLIGATGAYGLAFSLRSDPSDEGLDRARDTLFATRPTAVNLRWSLDRVRDAVRNRPRAERAEAAWREAAAFAKTMSKPAAVSASTASRYCAKWQKKKPARSRSSRIATPAGLPASIGVPRLRRSTWRTIGASRFMFGWTKRGRAIKAPR